MDSHPVEDDGGVLVAEETYGGFTKAQIDEEVRKRVSILKGCGRFAENLRRIEGRYPKDDSILGVEQQDSDYGHYISEAFNYAVTGHVVTEDYLEGIGHLFGPPPVTVFTQQVVLRAGVEASARAAYLMDGQIDVSTRAGRFMNARIATLEQSIKMMRLMQMDLTELKQRLEGVWNQAEGLGFEIIVSKKGERLGVQETPPTATDLINKLFHKVDDDLGALLYKFYSSVTHASPTGLLSGFEIPDEVDEKGNHIGAGSVDTGDLAREFTIVGLAWAISFDRTVHVSGWDVETWQGWRKHLTDTIKRIWMPRAEQEPDEGE